MTSAYCHGPFVMVKKRRQNLEEKVEVNSSSWVGGNAVMKFLEEVLFGARVSEKNK